ncbi:MAG: rhamnulokinase [Clostridiales bacterium]|nr:rhamnulokinase [Candidatus Equinaster intestinalis]
MKYYLSVDIGASSGRHILGKLDNGKLTLEEIYRFDNGVVKSDEGLIWDIDSLLREVINGMVKCGEMGIKPESISIDTWGVDYVLLDENKKEIYPAVAYRNSRTDGVPYREDFPISVEELYGKTGIQMQFFNTVFQLFCDKKSGKLERAKYCLMIPDYLAFKLTGVISNEYTNATTTGMVNAEKKVFDDEIFAKIGIDKNLFAPLKVPGTKIGKLAPEIAEKVGFNCDFVLCGTHDTASAVASCPIDDKSVYISSGTWSLIGTENLVPVTSEESRKANFTNEGGVEYRYRYLKNIMGMWLFQNIRKNLDKKYTYDEMMYMAMESKYDKKIDPNAQVFVAPESMVEAVREYLGEKDLPIADVIKSVYISIAQTYKDTVELIEKICNKKIESILIVGGGSKDKYLNRLTAEFTGKKVYTGVEEGTATGNILVQIMASENIGLLKAREIVKNSFNIKEIEE